MGEKNSVVYKSFVIDQEITIIIPTYNREKVLLKCIEALVKNCKLRVDLIIVNDYNLVVTAVTADIRRLIEENGNFNLIELNCTKTQGCNGARKVGVEYALNNNDNEFIFKF